LLKASLLNQLDALESEVRRERHPGGLLGGVGRWFLDRFTSTGGTLDDASEQARQAVYDAMEPDASASTLDRAEQQLAILNVDLQRYRGSKDGIAGAAAVIGSAAAAVGFTVATDGLAGADVILGGGLASASTAVTLKTAIEGNDYSVGAALKDGGVSFLAGAAGGAADAVGLGASLAARAGAKGLGAHILAGAADGSALGATLGGADAAAQTRTWRHGLSQGVLDVAEKAGLGAAEGAVAGAAGTSVSRGAHAIKPFLQATRAQGDYERLLTTDAAASFRHLSPSEFRTAFGTGPYDNVLIRQLGEVPGFGDFAKTNPEVARGLYRHILGIGDPTLTRLRALPPEEWASLLPTMETRASIPGTTAQMRVVTRAEGSVSNSGAYPVLQLQPTRALDQRGVSEIRLGLTELSRTGLPDDLLPVLPAQIRIAGRQATAEDLEHMAVVGGPGSPWGFAELPTPKVAQALADQLQKAKPTRIEHVLLAASEQADRRGLFWGPTNAARFEQALNAALQERGMEPVQVLAARTPGVVMRRGLTPQFWRFWKSRPAQFVPVAEQAPGMGGRRARIFAFLIAGAASDLATATPPAVKRWGRSFDAFMRARMLRRLSKATHPWHAGG
jgi:hypothetical protein